MSRALLYGVFLMALAVPATARAQSHWIASGFVGADFGGLADGSSFDFGGQLGYLFRGLAGAEFVGDFSPNFNMKDVPLVNRPDVNAYMFNAIAAVPIGRAWRLHPYVAGGIGTIELRSATSQSKAGGNFGAGVASYWGTFGVRGDLRYYQAFSGAALPLSGLDFWRASIGVAARW